MLKTCFLPINYKNFTNKSCGEIICQTETTFTIICKLCNIKLFEYDEFIQHFRTTHWSDICSGFNQRNHNTEKDTNKIQEYISNENWIVKEEYGIDEADISQNMVGNGKQQGFSSDSKEELADSDIGLGNFNDDEEFHSDGSTKPLAILKKASRARKPKKEKRFECELCTRKFSTKFYLRFHIRQQHETKNFQCDKCDKSFAEKRYLTLHQRSHTGYACHICDKVYDKYEGLRYHTETHIESRNFICDYENCGKAFATNRRLNAHKRRHFAQPSFVCELCGSRQRSKESLIVHIRTHTGEKPFRCELCDRRFGSKSLLNEHMAAHETERRHVCDVCGKSFNRPKALYHHKHLHLGVKKFVCKICGQAYAQAAGLSAHTRKHKEDVAASFAIDKPLPPKNNNNLLNASFSF